MIETSDLYKSILSTQHKTESSIDIDCSDRIHHIDSGSIKSCVTTRGVFRNNYPEIGCCVSARITFVFIDNDDVVIPNAAKINLSLKLRAGNRVSEQIPQGTFFVDTRKRNRAIGSREVTITGYDRMIFTEESIDDVPFVTWPNTDIGLVRQIAEYIGCEVDPETEALLTLGLRFEKPGGSMTLQDVLGTIAGLYAGNFVISKSDRLRLITLGGMMQDTNTYLIDNQGNYIISNGGERIIV